MIVESLVLIVEDEPLIALDLQDAIIDAGFDAVLAASATEARDLTSCAEPAAAVVDMRLRDGMTGPDLVRDFSGRGVPVVVVSGEVEDDRVSNLPAMAFLSKPAQPKAVIDHIRSALEGDHYQ